MTPNQNLRRRRRVALGALAALVLTGGAAPVASASPPTTDPADAPLTSQPVIPAGAAVTSRFVHRSAVQTGATGFKLQYSFQGGVRPTNQQQSSPIPSEKDYIWDDGGNRYLQSDYPMPTDGTAVVTMTAQLIDVGKLTDYTVRYTSTVNRTAGSLAVRTGCEILLDGAPVDLNNDSPFKCEGSSAQSASGAVLAGASVEELTWSSITGIIDVRNEGRGPLISLGEGTFSTPNHQRRIIMNGAEWYPVEATPEEQRTLPYATIANGATLTWMAAQQNGVVQSEPDSHAQATFAYRIYLDGAPTQYWISGWAENYKYLQGSEPSAACAIYVGDPDAGGLEAPQPTPFTCVPTDMTKPNVNTDDDTTFQVRMASIDDLSNAREAKLRGVQEACSGQGGCVQIVGAPQLHVTDASNPKILATNPNLQGNPEPKEWKFDQGWSREVTNSTEHSFGIETSIETKFEGFAFGIKVTSETSYGYDLSKGLEYNLVDYSSIPYGAIGTYVQFEAWDTYSGELYFFGEGDEWYRVTGGSIEVPIDPATYGKSNPSADDLAAQVGSGLGQVQFRCTWDRDHKPRVLLSNNTVEKLTACTIPTEWDDTVPNDPELAEVSPNLIIDSRRFLSDVFEAQNARLHDELTKLTARGG